MTLQLGNGATQTESVAPYSLFGDDNGNFSGRVLPEEPFTLTVQAFSETRGNGTLLGAETFAISYSDDNNQPPVAVDDIAVVTEDSAATLINVLENDSDAEGDAIEIASVSDPAHGSAEIVDGAILYTPNSDFSGDDSFDYVLAPGGATARVTVTVAPAPDAPVPGDDAASVDEGQSVTIDVLANDSDPDGDALTLQSVDGPDNGSAEIVDGQIVYTPDAGFVGNETFEYTITDPFGNTANGLVTVQVEEIEPPVVTNLILNGSFENPEITAPSNFQFFDDIVGWQASDGFELQAASERFTITASDGFQWLEIDVRDNVDRIYQDVQTEAGRTYNLSLDAAWRDSQESGAIQVFWAGELIDVILPASNTSFTTYSYSVIGTGGSDRLEFREPAGSNNGEGSLIDNVVLTLDNSAPANLAPSTSDDAADILEGGSVLIDVLANDSDPEGGLLTLQSVSDPANGVAEIEDGQILYTANDGFTGDDTFTYTVVDPQGNASTEKVSVTVEDNLAPEAVDDVATAVAGELTTIDVLANDSDPENEALTLVSVGPAGNGQTFIENGLANYVPNPDFVGEDSFEYVVADAFGNVSTAMVTLNVEPDGEPENLLSIFLVDSRTNQVVDDVTDGQIDRTLLSNGEFSFEARYQGDAASVTFALSDGYTQTENVSPYALFGDRNGNFSGRDLPDEPFSATITAFDGSGGSGDILATDEFFFSFTDDAV